MAIEAITWQRYVSCGMVDTITNRGLSKAATKPNSTLSYRFDSSRNTGQSLGPRITSLYRIIAVKRDPTISIPGGTRGDPYIVFTRAIIPI